MQIKATSEFLIDSCLLLSVAIHTENSQNVAWINWIVNNLSVQFWLENLCAVLWPTGSPLLPLWVSGVDQGLLRAARLRDVRTLSGQQEGNARAFLHRPQVQGRVWWDLEATHCPGFSLSYLT